MLLLTSRGKNGNDQRELGVIVAVTFKDLFIYVGGGEKEIVCGQGGGVGGAEERASRAYSPMSMELDSGLIS